ncbi:arylamine N-acetyltransferase [Aquimarina sp. 2201CG1-2-11]|uniref:arylamine N-acetyltransferase n=1 Tax=Aquimarina discodermiae TaxID=3231043 RepID=UPI0034623821
MNNQTFAEPSIALNPEIAQSVLNRFGIDPQIECNEEGLTLLYKAWCRNIPFDNFWKRLAISQNTFSDHDQMQADSFFKIWLEYGVGGTCWTTTNAMFQLLKYMGFDVYVVGGSMGDMGVVNHGSLIVSVDEGKEFVVDTSILNEKPIDISGAELEHPIHTIQLSEESDTVKVLFEHVSKKDFMPCAIMKNGIGLDQLKEHYDISIENSLFNDCVYIRKNDENGVSAIIGNTFFVKTAISIEKRELNETELSEVLINVMGFSKEIVSHITNTNLFHTPQECILLTLTK